MLAKNRFLLFWGEEILFLGRTYIIERKYMGIVVINDFGEIIKK
jgi:hypothetical protein